MCMIGLVGENIKELTLDQKIIDEDMEQMIGYFGYLDPSALNKKSWRNNNYIIKVQKNYET